MKKKNLKRSPFFYVGDKYKLMPQLKELFPSNIDCFYDVFCGGGSASMNSSAKKIIMNDLNDKVIGLHAFLQEQADDMDAFIHGMYELIEYYGLSLSELGTTPEIELLKKEFTKTYFAKYNKEAYLELRSDYNKDQSNMSLLYLLLIYGFNHMIRFNSSGDFNLPVGNVDWNKNVSNALFNYAQWYNNNNVIMSTGLDFEDFVFSHTLSQDDFLYFDPPYLITFSDYNKLWSDEDEIRLYHLLDELNANGIRWGLSNMYHHKGKTNDILLAWAEQYHEYDIKSNYISRFDNTIKKDSKEIYITNVS
ncbi:Dam family site-specific DNA-(adenine-N6)-methyltransferase [Enterococcus cecorum]|uniref:Dam family site-specific DNA-(adenine-N6)-methyltransferase n=1 Tax=Enterococcus cecorum TaxID=44008 RepID=UPI000B584EC0|nr:Dam family site-specific DNA-(adenine-N6)-methyltransferase [Enterococcus cecorum]OUN47458.1 DNA adenine methylase [Enterococcus cecorum]